MSPKQTENDELRGRFTVWITKTARNAQINYLRKESRQLKTIPLETTEVQLNRMHWNRLCPLRMASNSWRAVWQTHFGNCR